MSARAVLRNIAGDYDDDDYDDDYNDDYDDDYDDDGDDDDNNGAPQSRSATISDAVTASKSRLAPKPAVAAAPAPSVTNKAENSKTQAQEQLRKERRELATQCAELQRVELATLLESRQWAHRVHVAEAADSRRLTVDGAFWWLDIVIGPLYPLRDSADVRVRFAHYSSFSTVPIKSEQRPAFDAACFKQFRQLVASSQHTQKPLLESLIDACDAFQPVFEFVEAVDAQKLFVQSLFPSPPRGDVVEFLGSTARVARFRMQESPHFVSGNSATVVGTLLYDVGGVNGRNTLPSSKHNPVQPPAPLVRVLDLTTGAWFYPELIGNHPVPPRAIWLQKPQPQDSTICNHAAVRIGSRLYLFGGRVEDTNDREYAVLNLDTFEWTFVPGPFARVHAHMTATRVGHEIWIVGGAVADSKHPQYNTSGRYLFVLDLKTHEFRTAPCVCGRPSKPNARPRRHVCPLCQDSGQIHNLADALDSLVELPPIREHTATRVGRFIFLHGGVQNGGTVSNASYIIDTADTTCYSVGRDQARPRCGHAAIRVNQRFVACLGGRSFNDAPVVAIDLFDLATKTWLSRNAPDLSWRDGGFALPYGDGRILQIFGHRDVRKPGHRNTVVSERFAVPPMLVDVGLPQAAPPRALPKSMLSALESGAHSDLSWRTFHLHRVVLQARCPRLLELIDAPSRDVDELSNEVLGALLRHCYGGGALELEPSVRATLAAVFRLPHLATVDDVVDDNGEALAGSFGELFDDDARREQFADITFVCGTVRLRAHRVFVMRAQHFRMVLDSGMREAMTHEIVIDDVDVATMRALVRFLYTEAVNCPAEHAVELLALADRFTLDSLKTHVEGQIESFYDWSEVENVVDLVDVAQRYSAPHLLRIAKGVLLSDFERTISACNTSAERHRYGVRGSGATHARSLH
jgi:hypothetical protein